MIGTLSNDPRRPAEVFGFGYHDLPVVGSGSRIAHRGEHSKVGTNNRYTYT